MNDAQFCATGRFGIPNTHKQKPNSLAPDASFIIIVQIKPFPLSARNNKPKHLINIPYEPNV